MKDNINSIINNLVDKKLNISIAESSTGGMICSNFVSYSSRISNVFYGGVVAYNKSIKQNILMVKLETIKNYGLISKEVAAEMAAGVKKKFDSKIGVGVTGILGPDDIENKPIGLVYFCIIIDNNIYHYEMKFENISRHENQITATKKIIEELNKLVQEY